MIGRKVKRSAADAPAKNKSSPVRSARTRTSVDIEAGHCGSKEEALKINPHRTSALALKTQENLVPRARLELAHP